MQADAAPRAAALAELYETHLRTRPDEVALIDEIGPLTYRAFDALVARTAQWLAAHGIAAGDKVAVWLPNRREWLALLFALDRLGGTLVAVNTRYRSGELEYILGRSRARMLVMQPSFRKIDFPAVLAGVDAAKLPELRSVAVLDAEGDAPVSVLGLPTVACRPDAQAGIMPPAAAREPMRPVILFTTSGTTRGPKLVMHSAATLLAHNVAVSTACELGRPGARLLAALPLCGVFGLNGVLAALHGGAAIVMMDLFDAPRAARLLRDERITHTFGSDEMMRRIAEALPDERPFPHARVIGFASFSPGAAELVEALQQRGMPLRGLYGSSEVQALFALQAAHLPVAERALGGGVPSARDAQVRVRDPATGDLCAAGVQGEIEIRAPGNFIGYLDNPEATAAALTPDGYFRTGDLGYLRPDGSFVYLARMGDALRLGGFLVDPAEIEHALASQPGVQNAQVVGITLEGQPRAAAFVIAPADTNPEALLAPLRATLAPFKVPARLWLVDEFPMAASANGFKIQRVRLRQMAEERLRQETPA